MGVSVMPRIEIIVPDSPSQPFSLPTTEGFSAIIGREEDCDICVPIASVSSRHATLERVPRGIVLRDAGSTNGLIVDGMRVEKIMLSPSVQVMLGEATLVYSESPEERELFDSEKGEEDDKPIEQGQGISARQLPVGDADEKGEQVSFSPVIKVEVQKPNYLPMVLYAIVVFGLAIIAGMTYQHYKKTGNLLPLIWMGQEAKSTQLPQSLGEEPQAEDKTPEAPASAE